MICGAEDIPRITAPGRLRRVAGSWRRWPGPPPAVSEPLVSAGLFIRCDEPVRCVRPGIAQTERLAGGLYRANHSLAALTAAAAAAVSLSDLHVDEPVLTAVNEPVEHAVRTIRQQPGLPPLPGS